MCPKQGLISGPLAYEADKVPTKLLFPVVGFSDKIRHKHACSTIKTIAQVISTTRQFQIEIPQIYQMILYMYILLL